MAGEQAVATQQPAEVPAQASAVPTEPLVDNYIMMTGAVSDPQEAEWIDDSDLPDLPTIEQKDPGSRSPSD